jgi:arylsulfatase A-like enzyme/tetratricopeptide (TPR) repeat protein
LKFWPATLLIVATASGCSRETAPPESRALQNVVLITIDTLRADRVGRAVAPTLDRLAQSGVQFTNARTAVPLTLPAHVSLMTGTAPPIHGVRDNGIPFSGGLPTLAKIFRGAGYRTAAFVGAYVLDRRFGLADGFDTYDDRVKRDPDAAARLEAERRAAEVVDAAVAWLAQDAAGQPSFLWVHLYDPHAPYDPPAEYRRLREASGEPRRSEAEAGGSSLYDGEVRYADAEIARLLQHMPRGLLDRTVLVVAGDHGEGLGEHGEATHGMLAYDSTLRVPLIVSAPGLAARQIAAPTSLTDVAPTVLRLAGVSGSLGENPQRRDLIDGRGSDLYAETRYPHAAGWHPLTVLAGEQWKLIVSSERELYDIKSDPQESRNVAADHPNIVAGMSSVLTKIASSAPAGASNAAVSADAAAKLRALGYVGGGSASSAVDPSAPNPAKTIGSWTEFEKALALMNAGRAADALSSFKALAMRYPSGLVFQTSYARALQESGRAAEAVRVLQAAVKRWSTDATLFHDLAVAARAAGNRQEAMRAEQAALALDGTNPAALNGLGLLHVDAGRPAEAASAFERAAKADPSNASYWSNLGNARRGHGDAAGALAAYRQALEADPTYADAANGLGVLLVQGGSPGDAIPWFEKALTSAPDFHEARLNLGIAYQESGRRAEAVKTYQDVLNRAPERFVRERKAATELLRGLK